MDLLDAHKVGVVFMDTQMPVLDGLEALKLWQSKGHTSCQEPYFVIFSGYDEFFVRRQRCVIEP